MISHWAEGALLVAVIPGALLIWWLRTHLLGLCLWCGGTGRNRFSTRTRFGLCAHCGGSGRRVRRI